MDDPPKENSKLLNIKDWQWSVLLFVLMLLYLVLGAFIFRATEHESSSQAQIQLYNGIFEFILRHNCVDSVDLQNFANELTTGLSRGASLKKRYWIDRDGEEVESRWILTRAFVFSLTIITTIGYGNIVPRTGLGRLFCVVYALIGLPVMAFTLSVFGKSFEGFMKRYTRFLRLLGKPIKMKRLRIALQTCITMSLITITLILIPASLVSYYEEWSYFESIYFFFITMSTIGFGDLVLDDCVNCNHSVWVFVMIYTIYVFLGICVISLLFKAISSYQERKLEEAESLIVTFINSGSTTVISTLANTFIGISPSHSPARKKVQQTSGGEESSNTSHFENETLVVELHDTETNPRYTFVQANSEMTVSDK